MKTFFSPAFLFAVCLLMAGEVATRLFFSHDLTGRFDYGYHPTAGFRENADGTVDLLKSGGRAFRPQHFYQQPAPGVLRLMVFGHSVPYGYYGNGDAPLSETYTAIAAQQLTRENIPAESINFAMGGYGARRVQIVLRQALKYQPGVVILHVHDWSEDARNDERRKQFQGWHPKNWVMKSLLVRQLYEVKSERVFGSWLPEAVREPEPDKNQIAKMKTELTKAANENAAKTAADTIRYTRENIGLARGQRVPVILVSQASKRKNDQGEFFLNDEGLDDRLKTLVGPGVWLVSIKELMAKVPNWQDLYTDSAHLKLAGHELIGAEIARIIRENKLEPLPAGKP